MHIHAMAADKWLTLCIRSVFDSIGAVRCGGGGEMMAVVCSQPA